MTELDVYRELCSKYGKAKVWSLNADELCDLFEEWLKEKLAEKFTIKGLSKNHQAQKEFNDFMQKQQFESDKFDKMLKSVADKGG